MMWRFSTLFNYIRGNVRSGAWRVRETPSQLLSEDREDREDREDQRPAALSAPPRPLGAARRPAPAAPRAVTGALPPPPGPCGLTGDVPGSSAVRLPSSAALWYLGLGGQETSADPARGSSADPARGSTADPARGSTADPVRGSSADPARESTADPIQRSTATGAVSGSVSIASTAATSSAVDTDSVTAATRTPTSPASSQVISTTVTAHVVPDAPTRPADLSPAPAPDSTPDSALGSPAPEDSEPPDSLSALRVSFAAENDRLMAGLQNAVGASAATSRPHEALECFRAAAALGSPAAWFNCGVCFQEGRGTQEDIQKAAECYEEAVRLGHPSAGYNLALLAAAGHPLTSHHDVTGLLERAAAAGSRQAALFLPTWTVWSQEQETAEQERQEDEDSWLGGSPPCRSVSLPVLVTCGPDLDLEAWGAGQQRQPAIFYLHEAP